MNKMEETVLRQRKRQLEAQLEHIDKRLNGKSEPVKDSSDHMLLDYVLRASRGGFSSGQNNNETSHCFTMAFITKADREEEEKWKFVPTITPPNPVANMVSITKTEKEVEEKKKDIPTTTTTTTTELATTTLQMLVKKRLLEHYSKMVTEQVCENVLKGETRITIDAKHAQVLVPFQEYCEKEGIYVAHVSRQVSSFIVTLAW